MCRCTTHNRIYEYDELTKNEVSSSQQIEAILWRQIDLEREKVKAYEKGYIQEKLLRMKAVQELRRHKKKMFGEVKVISERTYGSEPMFSVPMTSERDSTREGLPWFWRADDEEPQPRTPHEAIQKVSFVLQKKQKQEENQEENQRIQKEVNVPKQKE